MNFIAPKISILVTSFNSEHYLSDSIKSIINSNFKDYEIIIVDDHSTDKSYEVAVDFSNKYSNIKVYKNEKNIGDYPNRNKAASYASGKYLKYLDSDDLIYPFSLDIFYKSLEENPSCALAFTSKHVQIDNAPYPIIHSPNDSFRTHFLYGGLFYAGPGGMLIRKEIFDKLGGFGTKRHISDTEFLMQVALDHDVLEVNPGLIWWRIHSNQESVKESFDSMVQAQRFKSSLNYIQISKLSVEEKRKATNIQYKLLARKILNNFFVKRKAKNAIDIYSVSGISFIQLFWAFHIRVIRK